MNTGLGAYWRCIANGCAAEHHEYSGWDDAQAQMAKHARAQPHDARWPLTITLHDGNGRQFGVTYVEATPAITWACPACGSAYEAHTCVRIHAAALTHADFNPECVDE